MKSFIISLCAIWLMSLPVTAQSNEDVWKERKELRKMSREALKEKASKDARKEAKSLSKEGWQSAPGALPIERQLDRSYMMQQEFDDDMFPKYLMGEGMSIAESYDAAKMQATELAKQNLAGQIQTEITALVENNVSNKQLSPDEAASVTQTVMGAKNFISQSIGRLIYNRMYISQRKTGIKKGLYALLTTRRWQKTLQRTLSERTSKTRDRN